MKNIVLGTCIALLLIPALATAKNPMSREEKTCATADKSCLMDLAGKSGVIIRVNEPDGSITFYAGFNNMAKSALPQTPGEINATENDVEKTEKTTYQILLQQFVNDFLRAWSSAPTSDNLSAEQLAEADAAAQNYFDFISQHPSIDYTYIDIFAARGNRYWEKIQEIWSRVDPENRFQALTRYIGDSKSPYYVRSENLPTTRDIYSAILQLQEISTTIAIFTLLADLSKDTILMIQRVAPDIYRDLFNTHN